MQSKFGVAESYGKVVHGRNQALSSYLGGLLADDTNSMESIIKAIIEHGKEENKPPYFTDGNEFQCTDATTNATLFYAQHLQSYNSKRYRESKEYIKPRIQTGDMGKQQGGLGKGTAKAPKRVPKRVFTCKFCHKDNIRDDSKK